MRLSRSNPQSAIKYYENDHLEINSDHSSISTVEDLHFDHGRSQPISNSKDVVLTYSEIKKFPLTVKAIEYLPPPERTDFKDDVKYKTELCKTWDELGECPYKDRCRFAHGVEELREKVDRRGSKKTCLAFRKSWNCSYGTRCLYWHKKRTYDSIRAKSFFNQMIQVPETIPLKYEDQRRLPVFSRIDLDR
jgi:hypothetical protein